MGAHGCYSRAYTAQSGATAFCQATSNMPLQEPPTIPRREEYSSMSEQETTAMTEEDGDSDSGMDVQVRIMAGDKLARFHRC